jgi:two-component system, chemotaxis family, protein-glutamate methylesterase/glutaminase
MSKPRLCVLVVDDDEAFAETVIALLERDERIGVTGWAANGAEAFAQVQTLRPDVITMDIDMPVLDGVEAIRLITAHNPAIPILLLTGSESGRVADGLAAGARFHLAKSRALEDLLETTVALAAGTVPATDRR